ncbi:MAG: VanW family protein, partial [Candidatus Limnocylindria bacterium]
MTTVTLPRRLPLPRLATPSPRAALIGFGATLAAGLVLLIGTSAAVGVLSQGAILPHIWVGGIEVGGLSRGEAEDRLVEQLPSLAGGEATLVVGDVRAVVEYADIGRGYEMGTMLDAAMAVGRAGSLIEDGLARLRSLLVGTRLPVEVHPYDAPAIERISETVASRFSWPAIDASVRRDGTRFTVIHSREGQALDAAAVQNALAAIVATPDPANVQLRLDARVVAPAVTTADAQAAAWAARGMLAPLDLELPGGDAPIPISAETIASWITFGPGLDAAQDAIVDRAAATAAIEALREQIDRDPQNASFSLAGTGLGGVIPALEGRELNVERSVHTLLVALRGRAHGASVPSAALAVTVTEPALTTAAAEAAFPQMQLVSTWTTYYEALEGNNWGANITIPATDIDGRVLAPGEEFEYWSSIGPVTFERGYGFGGAIINGRSTPGVAIGGGMCSTSTTLFNAALRYGLEMGYRANHYYYITRYPLGLDATVFASDNYVDTVEFTNDTPNPIVIRGYGAPGWVRFDLWSVPVGRSVVLTTP